VPWPCCRGFQTPGQPFGVGFFIVENRGAHGNTHQEENVLVNKKALLAALVEFEKQMALDSFAFLKLEQGYRALAQRLESGGLMAARNQLVSLLGLNVQEATISPEDFAAWRAGFEADFEVRFGLKMGEGSIN
jgi:hypothetical protein